VKFGTASGIEETERSPWNHGSDIVAKCAGHALREYRRRHDG